MKLIFAGTPSFAAASLSALHAAGHDIALVITQPDRPAGRGQRLQACAVALEAERLGLKLAKPASLKSAEHLPMLQEVNADVMVVAAYGQILTPAVLAVPRVGCLNIHASLLPRWRGAAPVTRAIQAGDRESGVCIMQMEAGLDTGPVILEKRLPIAADDTSASLLEKLTGLGAECIVETLAAGSWRAKPQPAEGVTYARKIEKAEAKIDWTKSAEEIERALRAFDPFPGCESSLEGETVKVWRALRCAGVENKDPGTVLSASGDALTVQCGSGALSLQIVQRPGGRRMPIADFMRGRGIVAGARFT